MTKGKETTHDKMRLFLKSKTTRWFAILAVVVILSAYAIVHKMGISVGWEGGLPTIEVTPKGNVNLVDVEHTTKQPMVPKHSYDQLQIEYDNLSTEFKRLQDAFQEYEAKAVQISRLPPEVQGSPEEVVLTVARLVEYCGTIWYSCSVVAIEVARNASIDTNTEAEDEHTEEAFRCVQICLNKIGYYTGLPDGDWRKTNIAVLNFQRDYCPPDDGKVGIRTWLAMFIRIAQEIYGKELSAQVV